MRILVIGNGGREHAIIWKLSLSPLVKKIFCAPGNGGTGSIAENVLLDQYNPQTLAEFAEKEHIDLTVVGPENYLAMGIVDVFQQKGLPIYGPSLAAAKLEASKAYAKDFMKKYHIPTAGFETFTDSAAAIAYIEKIGAPVVIKADGLAAGKGVIIAFEKQDAIEAIDEVMNRRLFGEAGATVVIEEYLEGEEVSLLAFCDGETAIPMLPVQDHKRIGDGDTGPNTGGMGTYTPTTVFTSEVAEKVKREILDPTIQAMKLQGTPFIGTLFLGLMITQKGPKLIEYNVRFGDPETQAVLPLLETDLAKIFISAVEGKLTEKLVSWKAGNTSICVVAASGGYPGKYEEGKLITGLEQVKNSLVFQAGTKMTAKNQIVTAGGRVLNLVHIGNNIMEAIAGAYDDIQKIRFDGIYYRKDIGQRELERFKEIKNVH